MKSLLGKLGVVLIGLIIFSYVEVWGEDWKYHKENDLIKFFYDADSITSPSEGIVRVWEKLVFKEAGIVFMVKLFGEKFSNVDSETLYFEINCVEKKYRCLQIKHYSKNNEVLLSGNDEGQWESDSIWEYLFKIVCK